MSVKRCLVNGLKRSSPPCQEMWHRPGQGRSQQFPWRCQEGSLSASKKPHCVSARLLPAEGETRADPSTGGSALVLIDHRFLNITRVQIRLRFIKTERKKLWHQHTLINIWDRQYIFRQIKYCFGIGTRIKTTWNQTAWINEMSSLKSPNSDTRVTSSP